MSKIVRILKFKALDGQVEALLSGLREHVTRTEQEPGTEVFAVSVSAADPTEVWLYAHFTDRESFKAHSDIGIKHGGLVALYPFIGGRESIEITTSELVAEKPIGAPNTSAR